MSRNDNEGFEPIEMIPLDRMIKNEAAQRPEDPAWIKYIDQHFDRRLIGVLEVTALPNGWYSVNDGWHRSRVLIKRAFTKAPCHVNRDADDATQATLFVGLNKRRNVRYIDEFFSRVTSREHAPVRIVAVCENAGWKPNRNGKDGQIASMQACEAIWNLRKDPTESEALLVKTLKVLTETFGYGHNTVNASLLQGMGKFLSRYPEVNLPELTNKLAKYKGGAEGLIGRARSLHEVYKSSMPNCIAEILTNVYNSGKTTKRIPDWRR